MKIFIITTHLLLGLLLIFYSVNSQLYLYQVTQNPGSYYPEYSSNSGVQDFVQDVKGSLPQRIAITILVIILGLLSIVGALAFRKNKRWAMITLPLIPLGLFSWIVYMLFSSTKSDLAWTGGILAMVAIILLAFFILEVLYIKLRKQYSPGF